MRAFVLVFSTLLAAELTAQDLALRPFEAEGLAALRGGEYATCARIYSEASMRHKDEPSPPFVAARCYARLGDVRRAREQLSEAVRRGYRNCRNIVEEKGLAPLTDLLERCEANAERFVQTSNPELLAAYLADRADRSVEIVDVDATRRRDSVRRDLVRIALATRALRTAEDHLHAALIMQHGSTPSDFALARDLARKAAELRPWLAEARWLHAAATDRHLRSIGQPQIFGTQYEQKDGVWTLEPFDPSAVSDEERARWRVHSLAERRRFIDALNRDPTQ